MVARGGCLRSLWVAVHGRSGWLFIVALVAIGGHSGWPFIVARVASYGRWRWLLTVAQGGCSSSLWVAIRGPSEGPLATKQ